MGMYTEVCAAFDLVASTPRDVTDMIKAMMGDGDLDALTKPDHPLFDETRRWPYMLQGGSGYFDGGTHASIERENHSGWWLVDIRCNLKNYHQEIEHFLDWIAPYIRVHGDRLYIGTTRYEEDPLPTLMIVQRAPRQIIYVPVTEGE